MSQSSKATARKRVPCTCTTFLCRGQTYVTETGDLLPGKLVPASTRAYHRKKEKVAQPMGPIDPPAQVPMVEPPDPFEETPNAKDQYAGPPPSRYKGQRALGEAAEQNPNLEDLMGSTPSYQQRSLFLLICVLAAWLHIYCGLSRSATSTTLKFLESIVLAAIRVGESLSVRSITPRSAPLSTDPHLKLPRDTRTAMAALTIEPDILRSICCPKCFSQYSLEDLPDVCRRRETPRSKPCDEQLWTKRITRGGPRRVPRRLYATQNFESWLEFFLSRPGIEDLIEKSYLDRPASSTMHSILDSPAWRSLGDYTMERSNLTFSFFIDWFNPFTNKIAGKSVSCGAIMFFCLNLPYELQHKPENTFFAGITPPPKEPTVTTITALADPVVKQFEKFYHGAKVRTFCHPGGVLRRAAILPAIGDLLAMRKALGFAGVAAHQFCSFCTLQRIDIEDLDYSSWTLRVGVEVLAAAKAWKTAKTKKQREELFRRNGVRWSSLHHLVYRDPVRHTILGVMHNWIEGIVQHHVRVKWGVGVPTSSKVAEPDSPGGFVTPPPSPVGSKSLDLDMNVVNGELDALVEESRAHHDQPSLAKRLRSQTSMLNFDFGRIEDELDMDIDGEFQPGGSEDEEDEEDDGDEESEQEWRVSCVFNALQLSEIHKCIANAIIPSWLERPPRNLGEKAHGKLKADQWLTLINTFLPLILPELWSITDSDRDRELLINFHDLVSCTNIVCSYSTSETLADKYLEHYISYRRSSSTLFPKLKSRPNHHYAMHNAQLLKFWGPLIPLSEFAGERHNGTLQKVNTNQHLWELDFTMLRQICRKGRLTALIAGGTALAGTLGTSLGILDVNGGQSKAATTKPGQKMSEHDYESIRLYLNSSGLISYRHHRNMPHPLDAVVLPPFATPTSHITHRDRVYSTSSFHIGNSSLTYRANGRLEAGIIRSAWRIQLSSMSRTFLVVTPYEKLSDADEAQNPYSFLPGFLCSVVYENTPKDLCANRVIEAGCIVSHLPYYVRPSGTFGIRRATRVLINSLHRGRALDSAA